MAIVEWSKGIHNAKKVFIFFKTAAVVCVCMCVSTREREREREREINWKEKKKTENKPPVTFSF